MNRTAAIALMLSTGFAVSTRSYAQLYTVQAKVPFSFSVNNSTLPAGTYQIQRYINSELLILRDSNRRPVLTMMGMPADSTAVLRDVLVFHRYGDQYFLSRISNQIFPINYKFGPTESEKSAMAKAQLANSPSPKDVTIALK